MRSKLNLAARRLLNLDALILAALFLVALAVRVVGVRGWLPYVVHPDEPKLVDSAVHIIKTGDLNPHLYIWPSLYIYLEALVIRACVTWGTLRGYYNGPASLPDVSHLFSLAPGVYMWARTFTALVGALTAPVLYLVGRRMFNGSRRVGVVAALMLAASPLHVEYSHFALTDVPLALAGLLVLWASYHLSRARPASPNTLWLALLSGLLAGIATATKYNGLYILAVPLIAWLMLQLQRRQPTQFDIPNSKFKIQNSKLLAAIPLGAIVGFLLCEPYLILDWPSFFNGFTFQVGAYEPADNLNQVWHSINEHLTNFASRDAHFLLPAALGAFALLLNPPLRNRFWLLVPFPILYLLAMSRFSLTYVRNLIITMPFLALLGGFLIDLVATQLVTVARTSGLSLPQNRRLWDAARWVVVGIIAAVVAGPPLINSASYALYMQRTDNRTTIWNWMQERMRMGERFAAELHPWHVQDWPDVLAFDVENQGRQFPLTARPPAWYAQHGYDYVVLSTSYKDIQRDPAIWPLYQSLIEVQRLPGEQEGGKGPRITVLSTGRRPIGMPPVMHPIYAQYEEFAALLGYDLAPLTSTDTLLDPAAPPPTGPFKPGEAIGLNLYYRALRDGTPNDPNWQVWIHLVDPQTGGTVAQLDVPPLTAQLRNYPNVQREFHPISKWHQGELVPGVYNFPIPPDLPPGTYRLETGMWVPPNGPGAKITYSGPAPGEQSPDRINLGDIRIE
ncbi:MAG TPA: phospholipid carrier-dependent glycosyltransferase [Chloroflexia bacterium]|jgi:4-amino-4-deoxy-L-arabinose transferase-like glycosyltransferase